MQLRPIGLFFTLLAFAGFALFCGIVIVSVCPDVAAVCAGAFAVPPTSLLRVMFTVLAVFALSVLAGFDVFSPAERPFPNRRSSKNSASDSPLFLLNEVYRL